MSKSPFLPIIRSHYPTATDTHEAVLRLFRLIRSELGLEPEQIMHADSICSDDVNALEYPEEARRMLGPFNMGGLNGFPFTGLTGMNAFAHHVPDSGAVFVFYGPHIGITEAGAIGEINRAGQSASSACCGAARAALRQLTEGNIVRDQVSELDYQQNQLEQILLRQESRIRIAENPIREATEVFYEAIDERINLLAEQTRYPCEYLILMGSILINGDHHMGSYAELRRLDFIHLPTRHRTDMRRAYTDL